MIRRLRLQLGRPRTALIVAPHPDDETIGAAGLIRMLVRRGTRVRVLIVSDGAASHPGSRSWPRRRLVAARRAESRRALARLGVTAGAITFLGLPDGALPDGPANSLKRALRRVERADLLVGPAGDDAHPDHRWVSSVLVDAPAVRRLAYRVWPPRRRMAGRVLRLVGGGGHTAKRSLIAGYRTQMGAIRDDPAGFAIARHELAVFAHPVEHYTEVRR